MFDLNASIRFKFGRTGHILGSCFIRFEIPTGSGFASLVFSGDIGAYHTPILPDPDIPEPCDLLIMESTYGDRNHADRTQRIRRLGTILTRALADGGKVFIAAFSLGRTQELLYEMDRLFSDPVWQTEFPQLHQAEMPIPVFIDSPLGQRLTTVYAELSDFWDAEAQALLQNSDHPLDFEHLSMTQRYADHKSLLHMPGPAVILAGSGMCTGGRIVAHLKEGLADSKNDVLFVGYQAAGTPGRDIITYSQRPGGYVYLDHEKVRIHAGVHVLSGYSAHADQRGLLAWVESMSEKPGAIRLVHGEPDAQQVLRNELMQRGYHVQEV
jgi:metallo-beta-lactamase family protein